jgi:hypothetical protein
MAVLKEFTLAAMVKAAIKAYAKPDPVRTIRSMYGNLEKVVRANRVLTDRRVLLDDDNAVEVLIHVTKSQNTVDILVIFVHGGRNATITPNTMCLEALLAILSVLVTENPVDTATEEIRHNIDAYVNNGLRLQKLTNKVTIADHV